MSGFCRILHVFIPKRTASRTLVALVILWISWFIFQVCTVGRAVSDEVAARFLCVSTNAQIFAVKQYEALCVLWATLENIGSLVAPFVVDVAIVFRDIYRTLPVEAQFGIVGLSVAIYAVAYSRLVRHMIFIPVAIALWFILPNIPTYIARFILPLVGVGIPVVGSVVSFHQKHDENCGFWISYWFLFPIMKVLLKAFITYIPQTTSSGGIYWRMQCIWCSWLVLWGGSDLAFAVFIRVFTSVWSWISARGVVSSIMQVLFTWKRKADTLRAPGARATWQLQEKLGKLASLGKNTAVLVALVALLVVLITYKLLSLVSSAIVWPWFLYELGNTSRRRMKQLYRAKIALALLFLLCDWVFRQRWFIVPSFILDFVRIPLLLALNMFGETILEIMVAFATACTLSGIFTRTPDEATTDDVAAADVRGTDAATHVANAVTDTPAEVTERGPGNDGPITSDGLRRRITQGEDSELEHL